MSHKSMAEQAVYEQGKHMQQPATASNPNFCFTVMVSFAADPVLEKVTPRTEL